MLFKSHKDRLAYYFCKKAYKQKYKKITVGSCGTYALALSAYAKQFNIKCVCFIPKSYKNPNISLIKIINPKTKIIFTKGLYDQAVDKSIKYANKNYQSVFDANTEGKNKKRCFKPFVKLAKQLSILDKKTTYHIWIPVGNGTLATGIFRGVRKYFKKHTIVFHLVSSKNNSIILDNLKKKTKQKTKLLKETFFNEPLTSSRLPYNIKEIKNFVKKTHSFIHEVSDEDLSEASFKLQQEEKIETNVFGCAGLAALLKSPKTEFKKTDRHIIILTN